MQAVYTWVREPRSHCNTSRAHSKQLPATTLMLPPLPRCSQDPSTALAPLQGGEPLPYSWRVFAG